ncbi:hypothetical protein Q7P35_009436 [Cladosporium inversicolor]
MRQQLAREARYRRQQPSDSHASVTIAHSCMVKVIRSPQSDVDGCPISEHRPQIFIFTKLEACRLSNSGFWCFAQLFEPDPDWCQLTILSQAPTHYVMEVFSGHTTSSLVLIRYSDALFTPQQRETMHDWVVEDTNTDHKATVFSIRIAMSASITELKAQLGLNIPKIPSKTEPAVVIELFKGFAKIKKHYADHKPPQVRGSDAIRNDASRLFEELGPALWPDLDKEAGIPSWLSKPSGDSRRYYSNIIDRDFLADRFHELVCEKLNQHHGNVQSRKRKTNTSLEPEDLFDGGETRSFEHTDLSVGQDGTKDGLNSVAKHSTSGKNKARNKDRIPLAIDREPTQSITATPAADLNDQRLMGQTPTKLLEAESKLQHSKLNQYMAQRGGPDGMDLDRLDNSSADFEITPAGVRRRNSSVYEMPQSPPRYMGQNERPLSLTTQNTKRPLSDDKRDRKAKRNKNHPDVQTAKHTLVVVLKLTRGKGVSERPKTVPPQQPHVLLPSVEADEIAVRHASTLASCCDTVASDTGVGDERTSIPPAIPNQDSRNGTSEAAMDAPCDLNDTGSAYGATEPTAPAGGTIRPASAVLSPSHEAHKQWESHVMAEFRKIWSDEAYEIVHEILTTSLSKHTPEELVSNILLPVLKQIRDHLPSTTVLNDPLSTSNNAHERHNAKALDSQQQELVALQPNVGPFDTASRVQHPLATGAIDTDLDTRPIQEPAQPPQVDCSHSASNVLNDEATTVLEMPGDIEPARDMIVANGNTQTQWAGMDVSHSTQSQIPSEPRNLYADPDAVNNAAASRLEGPRSPETKTNQATTSSQLIRTTIDEPGLQELVNKLETTTPSSDEDGNALRGVFFRLYLDEEADTLEPQCCVTLTGLTTRDELFTMMQDDLQDDLDTGDQIMAVKVKRADGEIFRGPNVRTMPIKRVGKQDMWSELVNTLLEYGAGEEGLRGYVKVKKYVDAK